MNRIIRRTTFGLALVVGALGTGPGTAGATGTGFTTPDAAPPPPSRTGTIVVAAPPARSTTCEGNGRCSVLEGACELVGGDYNGWQSDDPGHGHAHGMCTWPWE